MKKYVAAVLLVVGGILGAGTAHALSNTYYGVIEEDYFVKVGTGDFKTELTAAEEKSGLWEKRLFHIDPVNKTAVYVEPYNGGPVNN